MEVRMQMRSQIHVKFLLSFEGKNPKMTALNFKNLWKYWTKGIGTASLLNQDLDPDPHKTYVDPKLLFKKGNRIPKPFLCLPTIDLPTSLKTSLKMGWNLRMDMRHWTARTQQSRLRLLFNMRLTAVHHPPRCNVNNTTVQQNEKITQSLFLFSQQST